LRSDHVFQGGTKFNSQPTVGHKHKTDHGTPRGRVPGAPHERVHIMTIRSPGARGILSKIEGLLHCSKIKSFKLRWRYRPGWRASGNVCPVAGAVLGHYG